MIWIGKIRITPREVTMKYTPLSFEVNLRPEGDIEAEGRAAFPPYTACGGQVIPRI